MMLKKISVALLATALLTSPVFAAAKPKIAPATKEAKCGTFEKLSAALTADGGKIEYDLSGDALAKFNAFIAEKSGGQATPPQGIDRLIILSKPDATVWLGLTFVNGCVSQAFPVRPESFKKLYEASQGNTI